MSGHSKWSTIKRKKGAADAKRGQLFTRLAREISIAARQGGGDPDTNFRLRLAVDRARANNMPKDNIERAIQRGTGEGKDGAVQIEEVMYEGYAPHGVAMLIECVTDNRNRAVAEIRHTLTRFGGSMGETGSVSWQFTRKAYFTFPLADHDEDRIFELAVEGGADDVTFDDGEVEIIGGVENFKAINDELEAANIITEEAELRMFPDNEIDLNASDTAQVLRVVEALEELEDVQNVYSNLHISDEALAELEAA
ncbi:MAG: YebC/PmpR family DNA-binding transcriptional regulator [Chloroflexota bacterium]|nr:MAG: YebC/PmpR family DNA-binding transcriptional regulator [Chloroflexota bacterium]